MTTNISRVHDVKLAIEAILNDDPNLGELDIWWSSTKNPSREILVFGVTEIESEWAALGAKAREERYEIDAYLNSNVPGNTSKEAEARVFELFGYLQAAMLADITLGGLVINVEVVPIRHVPLSTDRGYESEVQFLFRVRTRLNTARP